MSDVRDLLVTESERLRPAVGPAFDVLVQRARRRRLARSIAGSVAVAACVAGTTTAVLGTEGGHNNPSSVVPMASDPPGRNTSLRFHPVANGPTLTLPSTPLAGFPMPVGSPPRLVNLWASWCAPCRQAGTQLLEAYRELQPLGIEFVGVDTEDGPADGAAFARTLHWPWAQVSDDNADVLHRLHLSGLPAFVLVGSDGRVRGYVTGQLPSTSGLVHIARSTLASDK